MSNEALEQDAWKTAMVERLIVLHIFSKSHEEDPAKAINDIVSYEVAMALDPLVSSDAVALIKKYGGTYPLTTNPIGDANE